MRYLIGLVAIAFLAGGIVAQEKKAPAKLVFEAKPGAVTYDHTAHAKREKNDCKVCHDKLFQQAKGPLGFKPHPPAEAKKVSCGFCHREGGASFATKGNCMKCHQKGAAKK
jgi:c(7)-type cytochrome triheme protein